MHAAFVDVISYWLWQMDAWSQTFMAKKARPIVLTVHVEEPAVFAREVESRSLATPALSSITGAGLEVRIGATLMPLIRDRSDNEAERVMMRAAAEGLAAVSGMTATPEELDRVIDESMPRSQKRRFPLDPGDADVDPTGLPPMRSIQMYDETLAARHAAEEIRRMEHPPGLLRGQDAVRLLNALVGSHFERLRMRLADLRLDGLLEILTTYNERFMMERALEGRTLRTEVLCWSGEQVVLERLLRDSQKRGAGAAALRFVIEVATAMTPSGTQRFDLLTYDELLALFTGYGYQPIFVEGEDLDAALYGAMEFAYHEIRRIQQAARSGQPIVKPVPPHLRSQRPHRRAHRGRVAERVAMRQLDREQRVIHVHAGQAREIGGLQRHPLHFCGEPGEPLHAERLTVGRGRDAGMR